MEGTEQGDPVKVQAPPVLGLQPIQRADFRWQCVQHGRDLLLGAPIHLRFGTSTILPVTPPRSSNSRACLASARGKRFVLMDFAAPRLSLVWTAQAVIPFAGLQGERGVKAGANLVTAWFPERSPDGTWPQL